MPPWQRAKHWWDNHSTQDFWEAVGEHLSAGYVWNSPDCFMLAKACRWNAERQQFELGEANCWFVTLAAVIIDDVIDKAPSTASIGIALVTKIGDQ